MKGRDLLLIAAVVAAIFFYYRWKGTSKRLSFINRFKAVLRASPDAGRLPDVRDRLRGGPGDLRGEVEANLRADVGNVEPANGLIQG